jgi:Flp pilus assembly pilin Flp
MAYAEFSFALVGFVFILCGVFPALGNPACTTQVQNRRELLNLRKQTSGSSKENCRMFDILLRLWSDDNGQDIAEYALMLTVILVIIIITVQAIGNNANTIFSKVVSALTLN